MISSPKIRKKLKDKQRIKHSKGMPHHTLIMQEVVAANGTLVISYVTNASN
jgi:hypothetical protein